MDILQAESHNSDLQQHMYTLFKEQIFCDINITAQDGKCFTGHKLVLTASSKFLYNWCVSSPMEVNLSLDLSSDVLQIVLDFCYTGKFTMYDKWKDTFYAANFLKMDSLLKLLHDAGQSHQELGPAECHLEIMEFNCGKLEDSLKSDGEKYCYGHNGDFIKKEVLTVCEEVERPLEVECGRICKTSHSACRKRRSRSGIRHLTNLSNDYTKVKPGTREQEKNKVSGSSGPKFHEDAVNILESKRIQGSQCQTSMTRKIRSRTFDVVLHEEDGSRAKKSKKTSTQNKRCLKRVSVKDNSRVAGQNKRKVLPMVKRSRDIRKQKPAMKKKSIVEIIPKIFIPKSSIRKCSHCEKSVRSSGMLFWHRKLQHFKINCSFLRSSYLSTFYRRTDLRRYCFVKDIRQLRSFTCKICQKLFPRYSLFSRHYNQLHRKCKKPLDSWLRYCTVKLMLQKMLVAFAKDRRSRVQQSQIKNNKLHCDLVFQCSDCDKSFRSKSTLQAHQRRLHDTQASETSPKKKAALPQEPLYVCVDCRRQLSSHQALFTHLKRHGYSSQEANIHTYSFPFKVACEDSGCSFRSNNLQQLKDHVTEHHPDIKCLCSECPNTFRTSLALKRHQFICHSTGLYNFPCQLCPKKFRKSGLLRKHEYFKHDIKHDGIKIFYCDYPDCSYKTCATSSIKHHKGTHQTRMLFPCDYCDMKLKTKLIREKHMAKMHLGIRPFLCQVCGLSFGEKHELQSHINNRHTNEKGFQCQYCPYSTNVKGTYYTHVFNVHKMQVDDDKRKVYQCPHCSYTSILRHRYQTHVNGHTNTRNYMCKICNKSFVSSSALRSHNQWKHSDKTYSCRQCDYQTKTPQKLNEHIRVQHQLQGFKPYKCPYCSFRCATGGNTRKHVQQVHKDKPVTYVRDDELIQAARVARASGNFTSLFNTISSASQDVSEDERLELSDRILHIVT